VEFDITFGSKHHMWREISAAETVSYTIYVTAALIVCDKNQVLDFCDNGYFGLLASNSK
jgi:hypothetical protein